MTLFDVIVIGGGPAGNQTALSLAKQGRSVAVLDYRERLGDKLCTGIVGVECVRRFQVPDSMVHARFRGATLVTPAGRSLHVEREQDQACVIDRVSFVSHIAGLARQAGAEYRTGRTVTDMTVTEGRVSVSAKGPGGENESYEARSAVIASGFNSPLPMMVGLEPAGSPALAAQVPLEVSEDLDTVRVYAARHMPKGFFGWLTPVGPHAVLAGLMGRGRPHPVLDQLLERLSQDGMVFQRRGDVRAWGVPLKTSPRTFGDRVLLAGDVAGHVKPATGGGIYYSLICAEIAAETLSDGLSKDTLSAAALRPYETRWRDLLGGELRMGYVARQIYEALGPRELDTLMGLAASNGILKHSFSFDWHGELVTRALGYELFERVLSPFRSRFQSNKAVSAN